MPRGASLLSSLHSPYDDAPSPFSVPETVETSPVEEPLAPETYIRPPTPEPPFTALGGTLTVVPVDVRLRPFLFTATYWCGLAILYAFLLYVIALSPSWRGPVIIWALLILTVVFAAWRHLPGEKMRLQKLSEEVVLQRSGGYYELAEPQTTAVIESEMEPRPTQPRERGAPPAGSGYVGIDTDVTITRLP